MKKLFHLLLVAVVLIFLPAQALALNEAQRFEIERRPYFDPTDVPCGDTTITSSTSSTLPNDLPEPVRTMITEAANTHQTDPLALMAIFMVENGIKDYKKSNIKGSNPEDYNKGWPTSSAGAMGPFQFLRSSFPAGSGDINNFKDAATAAAKVFLKEIAQIPASGAKEGDLAKREKGTLSYLFGAYNGGPGYSPGSVQGYVTQALANYKALQAGSSGGGGAGSGTAPANPPQSHQNNPLLPAANAEETQTTTVDNKPTKGKVFMVGDSITLQSKPQIQEKFKALGYTEVDVDGLNSRGLTGGPSPNGIDTLKNNSDKIKAAKAVVIALGTNAYNAASFGADIKTAIATVKAANPQATIYWVDVAGRFQDKPALAAQYQTINKAIYNNKGEGYSIISWFKTVYPQGDPINISPTLKDEKNLITNSDGLAVHPTAAGQDAFGAVVAENVANGGGSAVDTQKSNDCNTQGAAGTGNCVDDGRLFTINASDEELGKIIDDYAKSKGLGSAPLANLGSKFVSGAKRAGVNPFLIVHLAIQESSYGKAIPDGSFNAFGRTATASQPNATANGRLWFKYDSFADSLDGGGTKDDQPTYVKKVYIDEGKITIRDIMLKYAPPSDGNDTDGYIAKIKQTIQDLVTASGDKITCSGGDSQLSSATLLKSFEGREITPSVMLIHYTVGVSNTPQDFVNLIKSNKSCGPQGCSVQLWADRQGKVFQLVDPLNTYTEHVLRFNDHSIGIEIDGRTEEDILSNDVQYRAVVRTVKEVMQKFNIKNEKVCAEPNSKGVFGHFEANICMFGSPSGRSDPGQRYMDKLRADLGV